MGLSLVVAGVVVTGDCTEDGGGEGAWGGEYPIPEEEKEDDRISGAAGAELAGLAAAGTAEEDEETADVNAENAVLGVVPSCAFNSW